MTTGVDDEEAVTGGFRSCLPSLLLLTGLFFFNFVSRVIFSPLLPEIEREMGLDHTALGSFFLFISSGFFVSILLSGFVAGRLGHKRTIVLSIFSCSSMLCMISFCESLTTIRFGLLFLGYAAGLYLQSGLATIMRLVSPSHLARGMGVHELAPNVGFVVAPLFTAVMLQFMGWRESIQILATVMACMGFVYIYKGDRGGLKPKRLDLQRAKMILAGIDFWLMVLFFSLGICATLGIYSMLPLYLVTEHGMQLESANTLVSLSRISSVFMPLLGGFLGDRFGSRNVIIFVLFFAGLLTIPIGLFSGYILLAAVVIQPMIAVCFFPSGFAVLSRIGGKESQGFAVSLCIPLAFLIGGGGIPLCLGIVGDTVSLGAGFVGVGCLTSLIAVFGLYYRKILAK